MGFDSQGRQYPESGSGQPHVQRQMQPQGNPQWQAPQQPQQQWQGYPRPGQAPRQQYAPTPPQAAPRQRKRRPLLGCLGFIVTAAVIGIIIAIATSGGGGPSPWKAAVGDTAVINPADLAVTVHVTNTGKTAATPTCTVRASDPSGAYTGFDEGTLANPVQPGQTVTYVDNVTISGQGAQYVTSATVSC